MKSASCGRGKIKRTPSSNINTHADNGDVNANTSKSRPIVRGSSSTTVKRKTRPRHTVPRKSRKPAVLPCSLNECQAVEGEEQGADADAAAGSGSDDDSCQDDQNFTEGGGAIDPPIKTVESAFEGDQQPRLSENLGGGTDGALDEDVQKDQDSDSQSGADDGESDAGGESGGDDSADESDDTSAGAGAGGAKSREGDGKQRETKHIHPCICDLSTKAQARIKAHIRKRELFELRHAQRMESIDAELRAIEEEIARKQQEELEQEELFGDKYEIVGKKKKRMKRSARRASMVSLGVKQVINWKKSPRIKVRYNQVSNLRKNFTSYCGDRPVPLPAIRRISYGQSPKIPVRVTKAASLRGEANSKKKQFYIDNADKRPIFNVSPYY